MSAGAWRRRRCGARRLDRRLEGRPPVEHVPRLAVADRRERREPRIEPLAERPSLVEQPAGELVPGPTRDPLAMGGRVDRQPDPRHRPVVAARRRQRRVALRARRSRARGRPGAGCAGRAPPPARARAPGAGRRAARGHPGRARPRSGRAPRVTWEQVRIAARGQRPAGTARSRRRGSPPPRAAAIAASAARASRDVPGHAERLVRIDEVEPVMRDPRPVGGAHLGRSDVEPAVHLARVGRHDLGGRPCRASQSASRSESPVLPVAVAPAMTMSGGAVTPGSGSVPRRAYGPACSIRAMTSRPTSSDPPARWTSLCPRVRPVTVGPAGESAAGLVGLRVVVMLAARRRRLRRGPRRPPQPGAVALEPDRLLDGRAAR